MLASDGPYDVTAGVSGRRDMETKEGMSIKGSDPTENDLEQQEDEDDIDEKPGPLPCLTRHSFASKQQ